MSVSGLRELRFTLRHLLDGMQDAKERLGSGLQEAKPQSTALQASRRTWTLLAHETGLVERLDKSGRTLEYKRRLIC